MPEDVPANGFDRLRQSIKSFIKLVVYILFIPSVAAYGYIYFTDKPLWDQINVVINTAAVDVWNGLAPAREIVEKWYKQFHGS